MTTGAGNDRIRQKALMYAFGKLYGSGLVRVDEEEDHYLVVTELDGIRGVYHLIDHPFAALDGVSKDIDLALKTLNWIADGNEFPEN